MNHFEEYAIAKLRDFFITIDRFGLYYHNGEPIDEDFKLMIMSILDDVITECEEKE